MVFAAHSAADVDDGWVEAVVAGNSFEHYEEHLVELGVAPVGSANA